MADTRQLIYVPHTGYWVIVPTEDELIAFLESKQPGVEEEIQRLFHALGVKPKGVARITREKVLRRCFAEHAKRPIPETRHVAGPSLRLVRAEAAEDDKAQQRPPMGKRMQARADAIRRMRQAGQSQSEIAKELGLSQPYVSQLISRFA